MSWRTRSKFAVISLWIGLFTQPVLGQVGSVPVMSGIFPPGATVGTTVDWSISGRNLTKVKTLLISGAGVEVVDLAVKSETSATAKVRVSASAEPGYREVRLDGSNGASNLGVIRIDRLPQQLEIEPNDEPGKAQEIASGSVVVGVLKPLDVDHFRIKGTPGQRLTLDLETRRVGTSIAPVMTLFSPSGAALAQGLASRGNDRDCRMTMVLPAEGTCLVQVRDNVYGGSDQAHYRLRVDPSPFATALFPLGGPRGQTIEVEVSGGNLSEPRRKSIALPDAPGSFVNPGEFDDPGGPVSSPARLIVGDGPEILEPVRQPDGSPIDVMTGVTVNGRISRSGEVDLYRLKVKAGETIRFRVQAASMGSWLDSVITLRDEKGATLAENDDSASAFPPDQARTVSAVGVAGSSPDSSFDYEAKADGVVTLEVADRFGDGGPEYGYRLAIGQSRPDYAVTLLLGNANVNARTLANLGQVRTARTTPGQFGVFNLKPGTTTPINFLVVPLGRPGPIEIRVEGLPDGVTADPVKVRLAGPASPDSKTAMPTDASPVADFLLFKVTPYAQPGLGEIKILASSKEPGVPVEREASATIGIDAAAVSGDPITRVITRFPIRIVGEARPLFVGPPAPPTLKKVSVPGPLLQGDQLDLTLDFSSVVTADDGSTIEARAEGVGLATNTVISAGTSFTDDDSSSGATIHVLASIKAQLGIHKVKVTYAPPGGSPVVREVDVEVKSPIEVRPSAESIFLKPGDGATFKVEIRRETGFEGEVELKLEGLPRGVKLAKGITFNSGVTAAEARLEMNSDAKPIDKPVRLRVIGMARMPRGNVSVDSKIRPMIQARAADK
jgi:hypothetical protein